jgi:hypothetical protein
MGFARRRGHPHHYAVERDENPSLDLADSWYQMPEAPWLAHAHVRPGLARMQAAADPSPRNLLELFLAERDADPWDR